MVLLPPVTLVGACGWRALAPAGKHRARRRVRSREQCPLVREARVPRLRGGHRSGCDRGGEVPGPEAPRGCLVSSGGRGRFAVPSGCIHCSAGHGLLPHVTGPASVELRGRDLSRTAPRKSLPSYLGRPRGDGLARSASSTFARRGHPRVRIPICVRHDAVPCSGVEKGVVASARLVGPVHGLPDTTAGSPTSSSLSTRSNEPKGSSSAPERREVVRNRWIVDSFRIASGLPSRD